MSCRPVDASEIPVLHPVAVLRDAWSERADGSGIVPWSRFDPLDFPQVLPWVLLLRQDDPRQPDRLRYTICGDGCRQTFGFSYQGKWFGDDLPAETVSQRLQEFSAVRAGRGPLYAFTPCPVPGRDFIDVYRGVFGFSSAPGLTDRFMIVLAPHNVRVPGRRHAAQRPACGDAGIDTAVRDIRPRSR